jgi:murein DD-endopeptidase MepM/ murein hydrolase activator NlpD
MYYKAKWVKRGLLIFILFLFFSRLVLASSEIYRDRFGIWYKIKKGESFADISRKFHIKVKDIMRANNLYKMEDIMDGELIYIPLEEKDIKRYGKYPFIGDEAFSDDSNKKKFDFIWPTNGLVTWILEMRGGRLHYGVDIAAPIGTWIRAAKSGVVRYAGWVVGYGNLVIVQHDRFFETRYAHCSKLLVKKGDKVRKGEVIALVGSTGRSSGPHLHFEIRYMDIPLQPVHFLQPIARYFRLKYPNLAEHRSLIEAQREKLEAKR